MDDPSTVPSKSTQPEKPVGSAPSLSPVDPGWALRSGLLHVLNESALWPIGFGLVIAQDGAGNVGLLLMESDGPVMPPIPEDEHRATHLAYMAMLAHRFAPVEETAEERAAAEARKRIIRVAS